MNNSFKIVGTILLMVIYCFAIGFGSNAYAQTGFKSNSDIKQETYAPNGSAKLICQLAASENYIDVFGENRNVDLNESKGKSGATIAHRERSIESKYIQYRFFSCNLLTNRRKSDLIFPFQYFW